jgi:peptide/nickel transport system substrate-binding protein
MISRSLAACLLIYGLVGCTNKASPPQRSDLLIIATGLEPTSLNPLYLQGREASDIGALGYSFLTNYDTRGGVIADAATIVPTIANGGISRDGKRITYHVRRDVKWNDGYPLTARDVVFTYRAIINPSNAVPSRSGYDQIARVRARDPYTVVVDLERPQAAFVTNFFGGDSNYAILPAHLLATYPNLNHAAFNEAPIGSGPYRFTKWVRDDRLDLTANDHYYGTKPAIRRLSIHFIQDSSTIVNELTTHEVDAWFFASPATVTTLRSIPNHRIVVTPLGDASTIIFNTSDPIAGELAVRRAFASAIDRRLLVDKTTFGLYDAETGMRGWFTWAYDPHADTIEYDPDLARTLLASHGWEPDSDGIRSNRGRRLEMRFIFSRQGFSATEGAVPIIIEEARAVGIDLSVKAYDASDMFSLDGPLYRGRFQLALTGLSNGLDPDPSDILSCDQRAPNGFNWADYCSETIDRALQRGISVYDRAERRRIYSFIQRRLTAEVPYYFLWQTSEIDVIPSALGGYEPSLVSPYSSVANWRLEK